MSIVGQSSMLLMKGQATLVVSGDISDTINETLLKKCLPTLLLKARLKTWDGACYNF